MFIIVVGKLLVLFGFSPYHSVDSSVVFVICNFVCLFILFAGSLLYIIVVGKLFVSYCLIDIYIFTILYIRLSLLSTMSLSVFFSLCLCVLSLSVFVPFLCLSVSLC